MVSKQSNRAEFLSGSQKQSNPAEWAQDSLSLSSLYLGLKVAHPYRVLIVPEPFQTCTYVRSDRLG